jgi:hypothetical protein
LAPEVWLTICQKSTSFPQTELASYIPGMATPNLSDADRAELARILRRAIDADRFPLSPRVQGWKELLARLARDRGKTRHLT